jgi:hypothetical protein
MKKTTKIAIAVAALGGLGALAAASASVADEGFGGRHHRGHLSEAGFGHGGPGHGGSGHGRHPLRMLESFDADGDGKLTQGEIDEGRAGRLTAFDRDGDRALTLDEFQALWLDAMHERMVDRFQNLDNDGDAVVTLGEFQEPFSRAVMRMDRNGDGTLSFEDMGRHGRGGYDRDDDDRDDDD